MKNTFFKFASVAVVALTLAQAAQATPLALPSITGNIGFTGRVTLNTDSAATATRVDFWVNPTVNGTSGSFNSLANGTAVTMVSPWDFNSGAVSSFWSVGGFTFDLTGSSITSQGGNPGTSAFVNVSGTGMVKAAGYNDTSIVWNFSTQDPIIPGNPQLETPDSFTFSVSHVAVPDGASTIALLGFAVSGVSLLRKKIAA